MEVTSTTRDVVGVGVNAVKGTLMGFIGAVVTFIGFIAEKIHLEFLFIFDDNEGNRGTSSAVVAGEVAAVRIFGDMGLSVFAGGFLTITMARGGSVTDDDGGIFVGSCHGSIFSSVTMTRVVGVQVGIKGSRCRQGLMSQVLPKMKCGLA
jgi:hypothetical protein